MLKSTAFTRFVCALIAILVIISFTPSAIAVTQDEIDELKQQQSEIAKERKELQGKISAIQNDKKKTIERKTLIESQIDKLRDEIKIISNLMSQLEKDIEHKQEELEAAEAEEARYFELFCERVRAMEESGDVSYWSILFGSSDFSDLLDRVNMISDISDYDNRIIVQLEEARIAIEKAKAALEQTLTEHTEAKKILEGSQSDLKKQQKQLSAIIDEIKAKESEYQSQVNALSEDYVDLSKDIKAAERAYAAEINKGSGKGTGSFIWPVPGCTRVNSPFGWRNHPISGKRSFHGGIDIPAPGGRNILASKAGTVVISKYNNSYGNYVVLAHYDGTKTLYAHMRSRAVSIGTTVNQGQVIGYIGTTGSSTGNHLHFEIWTGSTSRTRVNPQNYF